MHRHRHQGSLLVQISQLAVLSYANVQIWHYNDRYVEHSQHNVVTDANIHAALSWTVQV